MRVCSKCKQKYTGEEKFCAYDGTALDEAPSGQESASSTPDFSDFDGRYRIISELGEGGMGVVYLGRHQALDRDVAIKFLHDDIVARVGSVERFILEARAGCKVDHENIVSVFDFGQDRHGRYYLVMEYIAGTPLSKRIAAEPSFDPLRALHVLRQLLSAAGAAHRAGIVHRDLKPDNVLCITRRDEREFIKILDFGLAKMLGATADNSQLSRPGYIMGTPFYMSPEQISGSTIDGRSDLYSIGVIAYEMLTGKLPFDGEVRNVLVNHVIDSPPPLQSSRPGAEFHPELEKLVMVLMAKSPDDRFQSAEECLAALDQIAALLRNEGAAAGSLLERTRAELKPRTKAAAWILRSGAGSAPGTSEAGALEMSMTAYEDNTPTTIWDGPEILEELDRLAELWNRRITELASILWKTTSPPSRIQRALSIITKTESLIADSETEIAVLRDRVAAMDCQVQNDERDLRFQRLDLVAKLRSLEAVLRGDQREDSSGADPRLQLSLPSGFKDLDQVRSAIESIQRHIADIDRRIRHMLQMHRLAIMAQETSILAKVEHVRDLRERLAPIYSDIAGYVNQESTGVTDVDEHVEALAEVTGAMRVYQAMLKTTSTRPTSLLENT